MGYLLFKDVAEHKPLLKCHLKVRAKEKGNRKTGAIRKMCAFSLLQKVPEMDVTKLMITYD